MGKKGPALNTCGNYMQFGLILGSFAFGVS